MNLRTFWPQLRVALRVLLVATVALGVGYPLLVTGVAQLAMPGRANGSLVTDQDGRTVGSALIGQSFDDDPRYFQPRPSAAGDGYDPTASGGSNLGPTNPELAEAIAERRAAGASTDDAVTASGSGLDPHISPENARSQIARVAQARGLPESEVASLVEATITGRQLGYLGEPTVNVLTLNLALDAR
ncbi:potassium-transporting ATPase subunit KdpC [Cellulomonas sp. NPDC089187]|uniref:potassium-transporting ATPase subunit KdpC n=1 Tax=Cellulomonas sp. NPDC089187 TaxID=3154970 RepID=UPI00341D5E9E